MTSNLIKTLVIVCLLSFASCGRPECTNSNPVFEKFIPADKEYKEELVKQIKRADHSRITFWFDSYVINNKKEYLNIFIQGDSLCARGLILVEQWNGIEDIKRTKGMGYSGAEFKDLQFDVHQDSSGIELVYKSLDRIID